MGNRILTLILIAVAVAALVGCQQAPASAELKAPTVRLARVEIGGYFPLPWKEWPAQPPTPTPAFNVVPRQPLNLAFVFELENPNDVAVTFDQMKFTVELEAKEGAPGEYFALANPNVYDRQTVPAKTTNTVRVSTMLDSAVVPGTLTVAYGQQMAAKKLSAPVLVNYWWDKIQDFAYGIKVTGGTADFSSGGQRKLATFEGKWPK